jgi:hypothetical protein
MVSLSSLQQDHQRRSVGKFHLLHFPKRDLVGMATGSQSYIPTTTSAINRERVRITCSIANLQSISSASVRHGQQSRLLRTSMDPINYCRASARFITRQVIATPEVGGGIREWYRESAPCFYCNPPVWHESNVHDTIGAGPWSAEPRTLYHTTCLVLTLVRY